MKWVRVFLAFSYLGMQTAQAATIPFFSQYPEIDSKLWYMSDGWANGDHQSCEWCANAISADDDKIEITLSDHGGKTRPYGCGEIHTNQLSGFGTYEASIKTAAGSGLNTAFFTYVGPPVGVADHDEIDFEFLGKDPHTVQVNYWVSGKSSDGTIIDLGFDASKEFHTYSFTWEAARIRWYVDGKMVHETKAGAIMPKNPGRLYLSLWSGSKSIADWLGSFTYTAPVSAEFASVKFTSLAH